MVDYSRLRSVTARQIIRALESDGFSLDRQRGSHRRYVPIDGRAVTVSFHRPSDTFRPKTLRSIVACQAQWNDAELRLLGSLTGWHYLPLSMSTSQNRGLRQTLLTARLMSSNP